MKSTIHINGLLLGASSLMILACGNQVTQFSSPNYATTTFSLSGTATDKARAIKTALESADGTGVTVDSGMSNEEKMKADAEEKATLATLFPPESTGSSSGAGVVTEAEANAAAAKAEADAAAMAAADAAAQKALADAAAAKEAADRAKAEAIESGNQAAIDAANEAKEDADEAAAKAQADAAAAAQAAADAAAKAAADAAAKASADAAAAKAADDAAKAQAEAAAKAAAKRRPSKILAQEFGLTSYKFIHRIISNKLLLMI